MAHHTRRPLPPLSEFTQRAWRNALFAFTILFFSIGLGMLGYHGLGGLSWVDSFYNAAMILTGMGPVDVLPSAASKLFAGFYALYSGVAFLTFVGVLFAPAYHRFLHRFHLDIEQGR